MLSVRRAGEDQRLDRLGQLAALGEHLGQVGIREAERGRGVQGRSGVGFCLRQVAATKQRKGAERRRVGEREGRSLPAGEFEPLGVQAHRGVVLVQGQEHRHRDHVPLKALVTEQEAAGESALHELSRPVGRLAGTRELRGNQHHQEAAAETVLGRPVGNPREPLAGHRVQARVEPSPHDQLRLEPLSQRRFAGIDALKGSVQCVRGFE